MSGTTLTISKEEKKLWNITAQCQVYLKTDEECKIITFFKIQMERQGEGVELGQYFGDNFSRNKFLNFVCHISLKK